MADITKGKSEAHRKETIDTGQFRAPRIRETTSTMGQREYTILTDNYVNSFMLTSQWEYNLFFTVFNYFFYMLGFTHKKFTKYWNCKLSCNLGGVGKQYLPTLSKSEKSASFPPVRGRPLPPFSPQTCQRHSAAGGENNEPGYQHSIVLPSKKQSRYGDQRCPEQ